jgi:hypothetical protein
MIVLGSVARLMAERRKLPSCRQPCGKFEQPRRRVSRGWRSPFGCASSSACRPPPAARSAASLCILAQHGKGHAPADSAQAQGLRSEAVKRSLTCGCSQSAPAVRPPPARNAAVTATSASEVASWRICSQACPGRVTLAIAFVIATQSNAGAGSSYSASMRRRTMCCRRRGGARRLGRSSADCRQRP